jgi:hypothetical protein
MADIDEARRGMIAARAEESWRQNSEQFDGAD